MAQYVNNKMLYQAYRDWYDQIEAAKAAGLPEPEQPRIISQAILDIPKNLANRYNFNGYTFKDEMIGDAIENLVRCARNFNVREYNNPYGYFTHVAYNAFVRRILHERGHAYVKHKLIMNSAILDMVGQQDHDDCDYTLNFVETLQANLNPALEEYYEKKRGQKEGEPKKRGRPKTKTVDLEEIMATSEEIPECDELALEELSTEENE